MWDGVELEMAASTKAGQVQPDPSLSAWRTVHALQRERGVSCVIMASNGVLYKDLLSSARQESDEAVQASESEDFKHLLDAERTGFDDALQVASATPRLVVSASILSTSRFPIWFTAQLELRRAALFTTLRGSSSLLASRRNWPKNVALSQGLWLCPRMGLALCPGVPSQTLCSAATRSERT